MRIDIPDQILGSTNITAENIRVEFAVYLYEKKRASIGQARHIAGLSLIEFQKELSKRSIYQKLSPADIDIDIHNLKQLR